MNTKQTVNSIDNKVVLGQFGKVHGIKGWLKLISFTAPPTNILDYPQLFVGSENSWRELEIDRCREQASMLLVHIKGSDDPESSKSYTGKQLAVTSDQMHELKEGDFYWHELESLSVVNRLAQVLGQVDRLLETGANDVLVVKATGSSIDDRERLIPYIRESVIEEVNLEAGIIRVNWEADYLD